MTKSSLFDQNRFRDGWNITISNTCVPPQILDILKNVKTVEKKKYRLLRRISSQYRCWLFDCHFRVAYITHDQPAHVLLFLIKSLINGHRVVLKVELNLYDRIG